MDRYDWLSNSNNGRRIGFRLFEILAEDLGNDPLIWKEKDLQVAYRRWHDEVFGDRMIFNANGPAHRRNFLVTLLRPNQKLPEHHSQDYMMTVLEEAKNAGLLTVETLSIAMSYTVKAKSLSKTKMVTGPVTSQKGSVTPARAARRKPRRGIGSY